MFLAFTEAFTGINEKKKSEIFKVSSGVMTIMCVFYVVHSNTHFCVFSETIKLLAWQCW